MKKQFLMIFVISFILSAFNISVAQAADNDSYQSSSSKDASHRNTDAVMNDQAIESKAKDAISSLYFYDDSNIVMVSYNGRLVVLGQVPSKEAVKQVNEALAQVADVREVVSELQVGEPTSFTTRSNDTLITTKVKSALLTHKDLKSTSFKVVTENGNVYLMGLVADNQAKEASKVARSVSGVNKVVLFTESANLAND